MGYDQLRQDLAVLDKHISDLGIKFSKAAEIATQLQLVRDFLSDQGTLSEADLLAKWDSRFKEFYDAQIAVKRLCDSVSVLLRANVPGLKASLKRTLAGSLTQGGPQDNARDTLYELWMGSVFIGAGFTVQLAEPDLVIEGNGLTQQLGVPCKYAASEARVQDNVTKGLAQLRAHGLKGFVALGCDQLVIKEAELDKKKFVKMDEGSAHPVKLLTKRATEIADKVVSERPAKLPSEDPLDELLVSVSVGGIFQKQLTLVTGCGFSITKDSQISADFRQVYEKLKIYAG